MEKKILETMLELGFNVEQVEKDLFLFQYEGLKFLYMQSMLKNEMLTFSIPCIYQVTPKNIWVVPLLTEKINRDASFVKAYMYEDYVSLFYEREVLENENLEEIISRMVVHLYSTKTMADFYIEEFEKKYAEDLEENTDPKEPGTDESVTMEAGNEGEAENTGNE